MAFLTKDLKIVLTDRRPEEEVSMTFHYEGGIREYVEYLNKSKEVLYSEVIYCEGKKGDVFVEVALQHNDSYNEGVYSFVNNITTPEGGTHLAGFRSALTKTFNDYARKNKLLKDNEQNLTGDDIREAWLRLSASRFLSRSLKARQSRSLEIVKHVVRLTV